MMMISASNANYVKPIVETLASSVDSAHVTYRIKLELTDGAHFLYAIIGDKKSPMHIPPAYQAPGRLNVNVGGVDPAIYRANPAAKFDSWLTIGITDGSKVLASAGLNGAWWVWIYIYIATERLDLS